jgi:ABC-type cobalamin transport system permease subunit
VIDFPIDAFAEIGSCTFITTPVLFVKMSAIVPAVQFTVMDVVLLDTLLGLTEQEEPLGGTALHGKLVQLTSAMIALAVPVASVPLGMVSVSEMSAP